MSTQSKIPQPTRRFQASPPSISAPGTSFISPRIPTSPLTSGIKGPKYQLEDLGVVPGSPRVIKRNIARPPNSNGGNMKRMVGQDAGDRSINTSVGSKIPNRRTVPSASLWSKPIPIGLPNPRKPLEGNSVPTATSHQTTPTRIPAPQTRPLSHQTHRVPAPTLNFTTPRTRIPQSSPALSICATVATAPSTPTQISPTRSRLPVPTTRPLTNEASPALSICATVATAMTPPISRDPSSLVASDLEVESVYSSASALALARYRAIPSNINTGEEGQLSRISSTTSFSSASSLARHRHRQQPATFFPANRKESEPMSTTTTATSTEEMGLIWQPDLESTESDPAANLWMKIEARLNRRSLSKGRDERGQWVLTARQRRPHSRNQRREGEEHGREEIQEGEEEDEEEEDENGLKSTEMEKVSSEFTISAYFDPDLSTPLALTTYLNSSPSSSLAGEIEEFKAEIREIEGTALFNMSAPLIVSSSGNESVSATPANTPLIRYETIQRVSRVRKSGSGSRSGSRSRIGSSRMMTRRPGLLCSLSGSSGSVTIPTVGIVKEYKSDFIPESIPMINTTQPEAIKPMREKNGQPSMARLDSQVQAALEVLSDTSSTTDSDMSHLPRADMLSIGEIDESTPRPSAYQPMPNYIRRYSSSQESEVGLGIGMNLQNDSIYSLPFHVLSPRLSSRTSTSTSTSTSDGSTDSGCAMSSDTSMTSGSCRYEYQEADHLDVGSEEKADELEGGVGLEEEEMLTITDLDTGYRVDLSISRLDELWTL